MQGVCHETVCRQNAQNYTVNQGFLRRDRFRRPSPAIPWPRPFVAAHEGSWRGAAAPFPEMFTRMRCLAQNFIPPPTIWIRGVSDECGRNGVARDGCTPEKPGPVPGGPSIRLSAELHFCPRHQTASVRLRTALRHIGMNLKLNHIKPAFAPETEFEVETLTLLIGEDAVENSPSSENLDSHRPGEFIAWPRIPFSALND